MMNALTALAVLGTPVQRGTIGIHYLPLPRLANTVRKPPLRPAKGNKKHLLLANPRHRSDDTGRTRAK